MAKDVSSNSKKDGLPRIIVLENKIIVLDDDWVEKNAEKDLFEYIEKIIEDKTSKENGLGKVIEELTKEGDDIVELEDKDKKVSQKSFYKINRKIEELYDSNMYKDNNVPEDKGDVQDFVYLDINREGKSALEIAGFRDMEKEKKEKSSLFGKR